MPNARSNAVGEFILPVSRDERVRAGRAGLPGKAAAAALRERYRSGGFKLRVQPDSFSRRKRAVGTW